MVKSGIFAHLQICVFLQPRGERLGFVTRDARVGKTHTVKHTGVKLRQLLIARRCARHYAGGEEAPTASPPPHSAEDPRAADAPPAIHLAKSRAESPCGQRAHWRQPTDQWRLPQQMHHGPGPHRLAHNRGTMCQRPDIPANAMALATPHNPRTAIHSRRRTRACPQRSTPSRAAAGTAVFFHCVCRRPVTIQRASPRVDRQNDRVSHRIHGRSIPPRRSFSSRCHVCPGDRCPPPHCGIHWVHWNYSRHRPLHHLEHHACPHYDAQSYESHGSRAHSGTAHCALMQIQWVAMHRTAQPRSR